MKCYNMLLWYKYPNAFQGRLLPGSAIGAVRIGAISPRKCQHEKDDFDHGCGRGLNIGRNVIAIYNNLSNFTSFHIILIEVR